MRTVGVGLLLLLLSLLLAFSACEEQQAGHAGSQDCARQDPEDVHHSEQSASKSPISIVLSEIRALRDEIENKLLHVERRSLEVAGVLCGLTALVLAVGVLVVYCRERAQDRVHYVAIQRAQSNLLTEFKQRIQSQTDLLGSKARLLRNASQSSLLSSSDGDSESSSPRARLPKIHSMPTFLGKGDWKERGKLEANAPRASSPLASSEGPSDGAEETLSALQTLRHACQFTLGGSDDDAGLKDSLGPSQSPEGSKRSDMEKENSVNAGGKRDIGNGEDSAEERGGKAYPTLQSPETIGQFSRSPAEEKYTKDLSKQAS